MVASEFKIEQRPLLPTEEILLFDDLFQSCSLVEGHADLVGKTYQEVVRSIANGSFTGNRAGYCKGDHHVVINFESGIIERPYFVANS